MQRREFAKLLMLLASPWPVSALSQNRISDWSELFAKAMEHYPWLAAFGNAAFEHYQGEAVTQGHWPQELQGTLFRTGPARHEIHGYRNHHWFDGDGMVQAWHLGPTGIRHQARLVETAKVNAERAARRALYQGMVAAPPNPIGIASPDDINTANTSMLFHHQRLLALWEAGSPYEIDQDTLATKGPYRFREPNNDVNMAGVPFSAHPRIDADGSLWNFGYSSHDSLLVFWHIGADGTLQKASRLTLKPMTMPHDFIVTKRHLVILLPPYHYQPEAEVYGFLNRHEWHPQDPCRVLVMDKNDLSSHFLVELPSQWIFHFGNGWEDESGIIRFDAGRADNPGLMTRTFSGIMRGKLADISSSAARPYLYRLDTVSRTITEEAMLDDGTFSEFPAIDPRLSCRRNRKLLFLSESPGKSAVHGLLSEVSLLDLESGQRLSYRYPDTQIPEEHLYIPRPDSQPETDDWILGSAFDWKRGVHLVNLFDAEQVDDGPVATAELPYAIPLGLHGTFVRD